MRKKIEALGAVAVVFGISLVFALAVIGIGCLRGCPTLAPQPTIALSDGTPRYVVAAFDDQGREMFVCQAASYPRLVGWGDAETTITWEVWCVGDSESFSGTATLSTPTLVIKAIDEANDEK